MRFRISLETAMKVTEITVSPISGWPREPDASFLTNLRHNIVWWVSISHMLFCYWVFLSEIFRSNYDFDHVILVIADTAAMTSIFAKMIISRVQEPNIQVLVSELRKFMKVADQDKLDLIQSYVDKVLYSHAVILSCSILGPLIFILAPAVTGQRLILESTYPYSVDGTAIWALTYFSQSVLVSQAGCLACLDFLFGTLLWYGGARIQMLGIELEQASTPEDVKSCIRLHQELIEYMEKIKGPVRIVATEVTILAVFAVSVGGLVLMRIQFCGYNLRHVIGNLCFMYVIGMQFPPWIVVAKYVMFELVATMELFLYTWPADNIMDMSSKLSVMAFNCNWVGKSNEMMKDLVFIMHKTQTPIVIEVPGLLPALTLEFYANVMKATFSYMTTIFAMVDN